MKKTKCPHCKGKFENSSDTLSTDGDIFICGMCHQISTYQNGKLIIPSQDYLDNIPSDIAMAISQHIFKLNKEKVNENKK
jgi:hypothetical protein